MRSIGIEEECIAGQHRVEVVLRLGLGDRCGFCAGALVVGHVIGLTLAHDRATAYWGDYRQAARSQYWMLAVMVAFTCFGLYLLSVANG